MFVSNSGNVVQNKFVQEKIEEKSKLSQRLQQLEPADTPVKHLQRARIQMQISGINEFLSNVAAKALEQDNPRNG